MRYGLILFMLAACAGASAQDFAHSEANAVQSVSYGTVAGAAIGGLLGNAIERKIDEQDGQEIVIQPENGSTIAIVQPGSQGFAPGDRVRVLSGPKGSRVERG